MWKCPLAQRMWVISPACEQSNKKKKNRTNPSPDLWNTLKAKPHLKKLQFDSANWSHMSEHVLSGRMGVEDNANTLALLDWSGGYTWSREGEDGNYSTQWANAQRRFSTNLQYNQRPTGHKSGDGLNQMKRSTSDITNNRIVRAHIFHTVFVILSNRPHQRNTQPELKAHVTHSSLNSKSSMSSP